MTEQKSGTLQASTSDTPIYMVRAEVDLISFNRWAGSRQLISRNVFDEGYAMHCLLAETFGETAPKPFRLITPRGRGIQRGVLYGYARVNAEHLADSAAIFADPLQALVLPRESIHTKVMPTDWKLGSRLGFEVLVRPVIRQTRNADNPGAERDAFQREAEQLPKGGKPPSREEVYTRWLSDQLDRHGRAQLVECRLRSFQRVRVVRQMHGPSVEGPNAVLQGMLTIGDPKRFTTLLSKGVGRHRSYGYGMLLLRPPLRTRVEL